MRSTIVCPTCPICDGPPVLALPELTPWFCGSDGCITLAWDPYTPLTENLMNAGRSEWRTIPRADPED
jgi:hypothetical protein